MPNPVWNFAERKKLYTELVENFGPYSLWGKTSYPEGEKSDYEEFLQAFADWISERSGKTVSPKAVAQQIAWATTLQESLNKQGDVRSFIDNRCAALEAEFIATKNLPSTLLVGEVEMNPNARETAEEFVRKLYLDAKSTAISKANKSE